MKEKTTRTLRAWLALSADERDEFDAAVKEYLNATTIGKQQINERHEREYRSLKVVSGPLTGGCPYCGR